MARKRFFPDDFLDKLICGDCLSIMREMPNECLDLVITSPPYNLKNSTGNGMKDERGGKDSRDILPLIIEKENGNKRNTD